jgi:gliding motility-associated-like protein
MAVSCLLVVAVLLSAGMSQAREIIQLGGSGLAWPDHGTLSFIDAESESGSIRPFATEPTHNLVSSMRSRGGDVSSIFNTYTLPESWIQGEGEFIVDGDSTTAFVHPPRIVILGGGGGFWTVPMFFDLGATFLVDRIRFATRADHPENLMRRYILYLNDGTDASKDDVGNLIWTKHREEIDNLGRVVDLEVEPQMVRHMQLLPGTIGSNGGLGETWEIAEMQVFGRGFVPTASFVSDPIDLGAESSLGAINWAWRVDPGAQIIIQTRSGTDDQASVYWRKTGIGVEISPLNDADQPLDADGYSLLRPDKRGGVTDDLTNWSPWQTYDLEEGIGGTPILSPSPRRYVQVRVQLFSVGLAGGQLDSLHFEYSQPPVARSAIGEISPTLVEAATSTPFTFTVRSRIDAGQSGFDALQLGTVAQIDSITAVRIDRQLVAYTSSTMADGGRLVRFPRIQRDQTLLEVDLSARVFRYGTPFNGSVLDSEADEVPLRITAGDAAAEINSDELSVRIELNDKLLSDVQVQPNPFTPNGDGHNDELNVSFSLLRLTTATPVTLRIFDLAGRQVRRIDSNLEGSRAAQLQWDGRNNQQVLQPPGLYVFRLAIESDGGTQERVGHISMAY